MPSNDLKALLEGRFNLSPLIVVSSIAVGLAVGIFGLYRAHYLDWSLLCIGGLCVLPCLLLLDLAVIGTYAWTASRIARSDRAQAGVSAISSKGLVSLSSLAGLLLVSAGLAAVLLACPSSSYFESGIAYLRLRILWLTMFASGFSLSLFLPGILVRLAILNVTMAETAPNQRGEASPTDENARQGSACSRT